MIHSHLFIEKNPLAIRTCHSNTPLTSNGVIMPSIPKKLKIYSNTSQHHHYNAIARENNMTIVFV